MELLDQLTEARQVKAALDEDLGIAEAKIEGILGRLQQSYAQEREWLAAAGAKGLKPTPEEAEDVFRACGRLGSSSSKSPSEEAAKPAPTEQQLQALAGTSPSQPPPASTKTGLEQRNKKRTVNQALQ